jgi:molecular chaperone GrpE
VSQAETADAPAGTVVEVLQTGYKIGERLLRPAMVVVARPPAETPAGPNGRAPAPGQEGPEPNDKSEGK